MTAELQAIVALGVVAGAALYVARRAWRTWRAARLPRDGCATGCDCH